MYLMYYENEDGSKVYTMKERGLCLGFRVYSQTSLPDPPAEDSLVHTRPFDFDSASMYLMYYENEDGTKVYTMKKEAPDGTPTKCAHPARFSPDDKFSKQRMTCKRRFGLLPTQKPPFIY